VRNNACTGVIAISSGTANARLSPWRRSPANSSASSGPRWPSARARQPR